MYHIVIGWPTETQEGKPTILYFGRNGDEAGQAIDDAGHEYQRVERGHVIDSIKVRGPIPAPIVEAKPIRSIVIPTLDEVIKAGYSEDLAKIIIAVETAKADALANDPDISDEELTKIGEEVRQAMLADSRPLGDCTVEELKKKALELEIDIKPLKNKADLIAAIELKLEEIKK